MTDHPGPDFLPYPLPAVSQPTAPLPPPPTAAPATGRWNRALEGVPPVGVVSIGTGLGAVLLLVLVSGIADRPGPGAVVTILAAGVSLVTGWVALRAALSKDSRTLVVGAQSAGVVAALVATVLYAASGSGDVEPVSPPSPQPTTTASPAPLSTPTPSTVPPPGAVNGFGVPTDPGPPITNDPTALGTLEGHVVDTAGTAVKGAVVTVTRSVAGDTSSTPQCPTRVTTLTDANGLYQLRLCQLGNGLGYHVRIQVGKSVAENDLFVNSGNTTYYDVILPR